MTLGAAGGLMIPPAIVQVLSRVIDRGDTLEDAIAAPRVSPVLKMITASYSDDEIMVEATPVNGWSDANIAKFESAGFEVSKKEKYSLFGRVHALEYDAGSDLWTGVADPDWEGSAAMLPAQ
jgi:gamma-glutamyltranspeptidase / glutathione hydrolase